MKILSIDRQCAYVISHSFDICYIFFCKMALVILIL